MPQSREEREEERRTVEPQGRACTIQSASRLQTEYQCTWMLDLLAGYIRSDQTRQRDGLVKGGLRGTSDRLPLRWKHWSRPANAAMLSIPTSGLNTASEAAPCCPCAVHTAAPPRPCPRCCFPCAPCLECGAAGARKGGAVRHAQGISTQHTEPVRTPPVPGSEQYAFCSAACLPLSSSRLFGNTDILELRYIWVFSLQTQ